MSKDGKAYVGQSKRIFFRIVQHLSGKGKTGGSRDLFIDFENGDRFVVLAKRLVDSRFENLDALEKAMIRHFCGKKIGYNKTAGNVGSVFYK